MAENPNDGSRKLELLSGYARLRSVLADGGRLDAAIEVDRKTNRMLEEILVTDPTNKLVRRNLGAMTNWLGRDLRAAGRPDLAVENHRKALGIADGLAAADPKSSEHRHDVAFSHYLLAEALGDLRQDATSLSEYGIAAASKEKLRVMEPTNTRHSDDLALIYSGMAMVLTRGGDLPHASGAIAKAIPLSEAAAARNPTNMKARVNLAATYYVAGKLQESRKGWDEALRLFKRSSAILQKLRTERQLSAAQARSLSESTEEIKNCNAALALLVH